MRKVFWGVVLINIIISCVLAIIAHEGFHALAARFCGVALFSVRPSPAGIRARLKGMPKSFKKQTFIFFAGSLGNFLLALVFYRGEDFFHSLFEANLAIGIYNLLPMYPLDGAQIFMIVFYKLAGGARTFRLIKLLSLIMKTVLAAAGIIQVLFLGNPSLLIAAVFLPGTGILEEKVSMMKLENLLNRRQRIISKGVYPARLVVAMDECTLGDVMQKLDYDRFHIIYVLDREMEIVGRITEQQLIKALQTRSAADRISDVF